MQWIKEETNKEKNQRDFDTLPKTDPFDQFEWKKKLNGDKQNQGKKTTISASRWLIDYNKLKNMYIRNR